MLLVINVSCGDIVLMLCLCRLYSVEVVDRLERITIYTLCLLNDTSNAADSVLLYFKNS